MKDNIKKSYTPKFEINEKVIYDIERTNYNKLKCPNCKGINPTTTHDGLTYVCKKCNGDGEVFDIKNPKIKLPAEFIIERINIIYSNVFPKEICKYTIMHPEHGTFEVSQGSLKKLKGNL